MPNGHASFDLLRARLRCKRVCHFLTASGNTIWGELSKKFVFAFPNWLCMNSH
jgi:hypothetical protein